MRLLSASVVLAAVCAVAGCTTVSAPPPVRPAAGRTTAARPPDFATVTAPPGHALAATVRPDTPPAPSAAPLRRRTAAVPHQAPARRAPAPPRQSAPAAVPGGAGVCALGRAYGGWVPGSAAAKVCRQAYGR